MPPTGQRFSTPPVPRV
uniref:Uncharacterized protein n=1 Tax=Anguilla anguilla TaxID=7936 RepID=A0A0E9VI44_ANGAN